MGTQLLDRSLMPDVAADLTRREFIAGLAAAGLLVACGGRAQETADGGTRTIRHFAGTTEVPVDAKRIVTLQDQNALLPLLELGVKPVGSAGLLGDDGSRTFRRTEGFDTSGIEFVGEYGDPNLEAIVAVRPDLIICDEFSASEFYEELSKIAPTVFVQVFERPLTEALLDFAKVVGREERAEELHQEYRNRIDRIRAELGDDLEKTSVSILATGDPGSFYPAATGGQAQYTVMLDLGLPRPESHRADKADRQEYSLEQLPEHDADVVVVNNFGGEGPNPGVTALIESPLYANLAATRAGQSYVIDATRSVGSAWARMGVFLDELEAILLDPDFDHDVFIETA